MNDMAELLDLHEVVDLHSLWLTDSVYIISCKIDEHNVFCSIFFGSKEDGTQLLVLYDTKRSDESNAFRGADF